MLKYLISSLFFAATVISFSQTVSYDLSMPRPQDHYFHIKMDLKDFKEDTLTVKMPVWAPGSYLVREFSKNVNLVKAYNKNGNELEVFKTSKNTWHIVNPSNAAVQVRYEVYSFELSVRTSFLDGTHGFVSGTGIFMYVDRYKNLGGDVNVFPGKNFSKITTALPHKGEGVIKDGSQSFSFKDYDHLVDCPIEIGNQEVFDFEAAGVKHTVAMYGVGNYDIDVLKKDMARIIEEATAVFGQNPNKEYTFIIHNVVDAQGGLEHTNSTVLSVNRWSYEGSKYLGFLSLVAHEYFHLWNVKRIRPIELGPFNYDEENYTSLLWVMEGFTSYYDELLLLRAGYYTREKFMNKMLSTLNYVEGSTGTRVQPLAHASYDAWIKAYRPNENSANTTMSYYSRGSVVAMMLDAMIINKSKGKKCLDHFLQHIYKEYYEKKGRGFTEDEFKTELEKFAGDLDEFFAKYIHGTEVPEYNKVFAPVGMNMTYIGTPRPDAGITVSGSGGSVKVRRVRTGSAAETAGLSVNDEIIGVNGFRTDAKAFNEFVNTLMAGDKVSIIYARENIIGITDMEITNYEQPKFEYSFGTGKVTQKLLEYWLRTDK
jgi:predicted metalloprotease with PDZ domain